MSELKKRRVRYKCLDCGYRIPNLEEARLHVRWDKHLVVAEWTFYREIT